MTADNGEDAQLAFRSRYPRRACLQHFVMGIRIPALRSALKFGVSCS